MVLRRCCRRRVRRRKQSSRLGARVSDDRPRLGENGFRVETDGGRALLAIRARGPDQVIRETNNSSRFDSIFDAGIDSVHEHGGISKELGK